MLFENETSIAKRKTRTCKQAYVPLSCELIYECVFMFIRNSVVRIGLAGLFCGGIGFGVLLHYTSSYNAMCELSDYHCCTYNAFDMSNKRARSCSFYANHIW